MTDSWKWEIGYLGGVLCAFERRGDKISKLTRVVVDARGIGFARDPLLLALAEQDGMIMVGGTAFFPAKGEVAQQLAELWKSEPGPKLAMPTPGEIHDFGTARTRKVSGQKGKDIL